MLHHANVRVRAMRWDSANALWAICAPTAAPTDYGRKPGPPIHPIQFSQCETKRIRRSLSIICTLRDAKREGK
eukprot:scaffold30434_cov68-Phaeocystis_antarctica.AAC.1